MMLKRILNDSSLIKIFLFVMIVSVLGTGYILKMNIKREILPTPRSNVIILEIRNKLGLNDPEQINEKLKPIEKKLESVMGEKMKNYQTIVRSYYSLIFINLKSNKELEKQKHS